MLFCSQHCVNSIAAKNPHHQYFILSRYRRRFQ